jgi:demethylspheroidene O-methyltransferase
LPVDTLAERIGLNLQATRRLLAAAASLHLVELRRGDRVALGRLGAPLVGNRAITSMIEHHATLYGDLADPVALLRGEGRPPAMAGYWPYAAASGAASPSPSALAPERVAEYSALMTASQPAVAAKAPSCRRWRRRRRACR